MGGWVEQENPAQYTKDSSRSYTAFNLTATQPHPSVNHTEPTGSAGTNPVPNGYFSFFSSGLRPISALLANQEEAADLPSEHRE